MQSSASSRPIAGERQAPHGAVPAQSVMLSQVTEWSDGTLRRIEDALAAEEPLEIRIGAEPLTITMRTPGHDTELAAGFLLSEGLIETADDLMAIRSAQQASGRSNLVEVELQEGMFEPAELRRNFVTASSCGICGRASIEAVRRRNLRAPSNDLVIDPELLCQLPDRLRAEQQVFGRTGGLHAAGLFDAEGNLLALREDIGRHNAVDKVVGWALLEGLVPLSNCVLLVSGRGGFEIVQKALAAGVPVLASVSAPSSLAVQLARELNLTLAGFLRGRRFVIYSGASRCLPSPR
jgi:FdhD protein